MSTMISQPGRPAHWGPGPHPDELARRRRDRLARASAEDMETALAYLAMIDPEAFEIALTAVPPRGGRTHETHETTGIAETPKISGIAETHGISGTIGIAGTAEDAAIPADTAMLEDGEPFPVCRQCGAPVAIFPDRSLRWQHFRGDAATSGTQQIYNPGHPAEAGWLLPGEDPQDL